MPIENKKPLVMNLQLFAEGENNDDNQSDSTSNIIDENNSSDKEINNKSSNIKEEKMFSQEEVNKMIEKRIAKEKARQEKALKEAERLAAMSEEERVKAKLQSERDDFESEKEAFESERKAYLKEKMIVATEKELINNNLPPEFANLLVTEDADSTSANIKNFKEKWDKALEKAINDKLKANSRVPSNTKKENNGNITWEDVLNDPSLLNKYRKQQSKK